MDIIKYMGYTEDEIYNLINEVRNNDNVALEKLMFIFKNKLCIKGNYNYNSELQSFFGELLLKIPLDEVVFKHKLINYILCCFSKKRANIFESKANAPIKLDDYNPMITNLTSTTSLNYIDELLILNSSLSILSQDERKLLALYYKYGYTEEEIGKLFNGVTKAAISKRKKNIIKKLRENILS